MPSPVESGVIGQGGKNEIINRISQFVEGIRIEQEHQERSTEKQQAHGSKDRNDEHDREERPGAKAVAEKTILQAEKFKAAGIPPDKGKGNIIPDFQELLTELMGLIDNDDDFFHITSHVDRNLRAKIEKGEFVELDKLLPKPKNIRRSSATGRRLVEVIYDNDGSFVVPNYSGMDKESGASRITNVRKWDQAFRVYGAIYSKAHPERSAEIWQYVYCINNAASTYVWDNVADYDEMFRQLMEEKPNRSWAITYLQGWNMTMKEHLPQKFQGNSFAGGHNTSSGGSVNKQQDWKEKCCWRFNKNIRCNQGCKWDHRCTYCGSWAHAKLNCPKNRKRDSRSLGHSNNSSYSGNSSHMPASASGSGSSSSMNSSASFSQKGSGESHATK